MIIEFTNLMNSEKEKILDLEDAFPDEVVVREISASFDGSMAMELITALGPSVIASVAAIIAAIISNKREGKSSTTIVVVFADGKRQEINSSEKLYELVKHE